MKTPTAAATPSVLNHIGIVFFKELIDALRDRRTLMRLALPALLMGPLMLFLISSLISQFETRAQQREVVVHGVQHAPTLRNYIERQNYRIQDAPADYEAQLRSGKLGDPVLVIPSTFEAELARGDLPSIEVVTDSANQRASVGAGALARLVDGFGRERVQLGLVMHGIDTGSLRAVEMTERDLASPGARASRITSMIPMFVIMAVLYGCLTAALDATSGERERGSLEPLLTNPAKHVGIVTGKWLAVALLGVAVAALASASFVPAQWLLKSASLQAMFRFGWADAALFAALLVPIAAAMGALLMAVAIRTKTFKESQASATLVMTVFSFAPMISIMNPGGDAPWHFWVPGLGQYQLMLLVLKGEALSPAQWLPAVVTAALITSACVVFVAQQMRSAASR